MFAIQTQEEDCIALLDGHLCMVTSTDTQLVLPEGSATEWNEAMMELVGALEACSLESALALMVRILSD